MPSTRRARRGSSRLIFVTGRGKSALVDYFDIGFELESDDAAAPARASTPLEPSRASFGEVVTVRQQQPLGLGHAVWCARHIVGDEPFAVLLPDDLMAGTPGALRQMVDAYGRKSAATSSGDRGSRRPTRPRAMASSRRASSDGALTEVRGLVEKPAAGRRRRRGSA